MKTRILSALAVGGCIWAAAAAAADAPKVLKCSATSSGMAHELTLTTSAGQVVAFTYSSVDPRTAQDCSVSASNLRSGSKDGNDSAWTMQADGSTLIDLYDDDWATDGKKRVATVTVRSTGRSYRLTAKESGDSSFCAPGAYLAPVVILTEGKKQCALEDSVSQ